MTSAASPNLQAHAQVTVRPAVEPAPDPLVERIVHRGVAERAGDAGAREVVVRVHFADHAHDGTELEERDGSGRIVEIDLAGMSASFTDWGSGSASTLSPTESAITGLTEVRITSRAYIPFIAHLMRVLQEQLRQSELDIVMHSVGRGLAAEWLRLRGGLPQRIEAASALLEVPARECCNRRERPRCCFEIGVANDGAGAPVRT